MALERFDFGSAVLRPIRQYSRIALCARLEKSLHLGLGLFDGYRRSQPGDGLNSPNLLRDGEGGVSLQNRGTIQIGFKVRAGKAEGTRQNTNDRIARSI